MKRSVPGREHALIPSVSWDKAGAQGRAPLPHKKFTEYNSRKKKGSDEKGEGKEKSKSLVEEVGEKKKR